MIVVSLPRLKALSTILALTLTFSLATVEPINGNPKGKKAAARSVRKGSKAKATSRSGRTVAIRRGSRSAKLSARNSKRGGRLYARGSGRRGRSRWRRQVATASVHGVGVHNFLSQSWTQPLGPAEKTSSETVSANGVPTYTAAGADARPPVGTIPGAVEEATRPRVANPAPLDPALVSDAAQAWMTARLSCSPPSVAAQPPFSMKPV